MRRPASSAAAGDRCGSRPLAEVVTSSAGTGTRRVGVLLLQPLHVGLHAVAQLRRRRAEVRARRRPSRRSRCRRPTAAAGSRPGWRSAWPISAEPTTPPRRRVTRLPFAAVGEQQPAPRRSRPADRRAPVSTRVTRAVTRQRDEDGRSSRLLRPGPGAAAARSMSLDADERRDDAAHAVDQQRAAQQRRGAERPVLHAAQRQRDQQR